MQYLLASLRSCTIKRIFGFKVSIMHIVLSIREIECPIKIAGPAC